MQFQNLIFFALLAAVFWFLVLRPQQQRQQQHRSMLETLEPGDEIVTIGGIYATVLEVGERVRVGVANGAMLEIAPAAVAQVIVSADEANNDEEAGDDDATPAEPAGKTSDEHIDADA